MKTTLNQKLILSEIENIILDMEATNDISSPSHESEIEETFRVLTIDNTITKQQSEELSNIVIELLRIIREI